MEAVRIGYARCSTDRQDLSAQRSALVGLGVPRGFIRRIAWSSLSYTLAYQVVLGRPADDAVSPQAVTCAGRFSALLMRDTARLLEELDKDDFQRTYNRATEFVARYRDEHAGAFPKPRDLIAGVRGIGRASEAKWILNTLMEATEQ